MNKLISIVSLISTCAFAQEYQFSTPISGSLTMTVEDVNAGQYRGFQLNLNSLTEHIYIDPIADTIREVGSFSYTPSASSIKFTNVNLAQITSTLTLYLAPVGGSLPFDTGVRSFAGGGGGQYTFNGLIPSLGAFNGSYSMVTGGQEYNGSFSYSLNASIVPNYVGYCGFLATDYPNSITLNEFLNNGYFTPQPNPNTIITAANGVEWNFVLGSSYWNAELCSTTLPSSMTANLVPEPTSATLGLCALSLLIFRRCVGRHVALVAPN